MRQVTTMGIAAAAALLIGGVPSPAFAAPSVVVTTPLDLHEAFAEAMPGAVIEVGADINVGPAEPQVGVPENLAVTLDLNGNDLLIYAAAYSAGIHVGPTSGLTIVDSTGGLGTLSATGADAAAGIGSISNESSGSIAIHGGTITANGGDRGAGIGSGSSGDSGAIAITGGTVAARGGGANVHLGDGAGIGASINGAAGVIQISGGSVTAVGAGSSAGIGSGGAHFGATSGDITISGGAVVATGGDKGGAGIGSASGRAVAQVTISGGTVLATGGGGGSSNGVGPGIGGSYQDPSISHVDILGGDVTAIGGDSARGGGGAGIGGAAGRPGVTVSITGGTVSANSSGIAAAIGGGGASRNSSPGPGAPLTIGPDATVTAGPAVAMSWPAGQEPPAVGGGMGNPDFGSFTNAGHFTALSSPIRIPLGTTVVNSGTLVLADGADLSTAEGAVLSNPGVLDNTDGTVVNDGDIPLRAAAGEPSTGRVAVPDAVTGNNFLVNLDPNQPLADLGGVQSGGPLGVAQQRIFAKSYEHALEPLPVLAGIAGFDFDGWNLVADGSGDALTAQTDVAELASGAPLAVTAYAQWTAQQPDPGVNTNAQADTQADAQSGAQGVTTAGASVNSAAGAAHQGTAQASAQTAAQASAEGSASGKTGEPGLAHTGGEAGSALALGAALLFGAGLLGYARFRRMKRV